MSNVQTIIATEEGLAKFDRLLSDEEIDSLIGSGRQIAVCGIEEKGMAIKTAEFEARFVPISADAVDKFEADLRALMAQYFRVEAISFDGTSDVYDTAPLAPVADEPQRITVNKSTHKISFENESESSVDVVIEPKK